MSNAQDRAALLAQVLAENETQLPIPINDSTVTVGVPEVVEDADPDDDIAYNTRVELTAIAGAGYSGKVRVHYRRRDLSAMNGKFYLLREPAYTPEDIFEELQRFTNKPLVVEDLLPILDAALPHQRGCVKCVSVQAEPTSIGWTGQTQLPVVFGIPRLAPRLTTALQRLSSPAYW